MSATVQPNPVDQIAVYNSIMPAEGPVEMPVVLDFGTVGSILVDFTTAFQAKRLSAIQTVIVRNISNPNPLTIAIVGTQETIDVPANADVCLPVLAANRAKFVCSTVSGVIVPCNFVNVPMPSYVMYQGGAPVTISGPVTVTGSVTVPPTPATASNPTSHAIAVGGTAQVALTGPLNGGYITNPFAATESLMVDPVNAATATAPGANGTTIELVAGQSWTVPPGLTNNVSVNAATGGHAFTAVGLA